MATPETLTPRPARAKIDDTEIEALVRNFYQRVRDDELLGPVFARRIHDWEPHLQRMMLFWRAVLKADTDFQHSPKGSPPEMHRAIAELEREHFVRWLALFDQTTEEIFSAEVLDYITHRSRGMARALSRHLPAPWS